ALALAGEPAARPAPHRPGAPRSRPRPEPARGPAGPRRDLRPAAAGAAVHLVDPAHPSRARVLVGAAVPRAGRSGGARSRLRLGRAAARRRRRGPRLRHHGRRRRRRGSAGPPPAHRRSRRGGHPRPPARHHRRRPGDPHRAPGRRAPAAAGGLAGREGALDRSGGGPVRDSPRHGAPSTRGPPGILRAGGRPSRRTGDLMARGRGGPTITQVAEAAGVSRATVSRVLNQHPSVDPGIGARVREAAQRLQYRPNATARNLSTGRTRTIALIIPDMGNPMFQSLLRGISRAAEADGYSVLVAEADGYSVRAAEAGSPDTEAGRARDARHQCDAIMLVSPRMDDLSLEEVLDQAGPVVVLNRRPLNPRTGVVAIDYASGMHQLVEHLRELGHRDLVYVAGPPRSAAHRERLAALHSLTGADPSLTLQVLPGGATMSAGYEAAEAVLASQATAALAFNDLVAFGLQSRLNEFGVNVPGDISVAGFDGIELS